jgi:hypothetical protein
VKHWLQFEKYEEIKNWAGLQANFEIWEPFEFQNANTKKELKLELGIDF